jgi:hypothetical protein
MNAKQQRMEVVVPVSNEEASVEANIELLLAYPLSEFPFRFAITIADNASSDPPPAATRPGRRMVLDTELLLLAERNGMRIHEVPVDWVEDLDSRVGLLTSAAPPMDAAPPARLLHGSSRPSRRPPSQARPCATSARRANAGC